MKTLCTIIIWGGMHYATPKWMEKQIPDWMWGEYEIYTAPYGTPLNEIKQDIDPKTTALIGFSAGGLDVLKNYNKDYIFIGLIDPSTRDKYVNMIYDVDTYMIYNECNWGDINKSLVPVANTINKCNGKAIKVNMSHKDIPKYFFETNFKKQ